MNTLRSLSIALIIILLFAYNGSLPVTDPVESNYALTAKEMLLSRDWLSPQIYGKYWYDKPVMFYWLTACSYKIFGLKDFAGRLPSALFALGTLLFTGWWTAKVFDKRSALYSTVILGSSLSFFLISKAIITDAVLMFFFSLCCGFFYLGYADQPRYYYFTYACAALGTLTKGPVAFLLPGLIFLLFLAWRRDGSALRKMKLFSGSLLFLAIAMPWYYSMYQTHGRDFTDVFLGTHNYLRATVSEHPENNVFYYYLLVLLLGFFPWSAYLPQLVRHWAKRIPALWKNRDCSAKAPVFLLVWAGTIMLFYQAMATKYPTYTYPAWLPLSILLGNFFAQRPAVLKNNWSLGAILSFFLLLPYVVCRISMKIQVDISLLPISLVIALVAGLIAFAAYKGKGELFQTLAPGVLTIYLVLVPLLAVPFITWRSGAELGRDLQKLPSHATLITFADYSAGAVFYSQREIYKLGEKEKPDRDSRWDAKYVMPAIQPEQICSGDYLIIHKNNSQELPGYLKGKLQLITGNRRWNIYRFS